MRRLQTIASVAALTLTAGLAGVPQAEAAGRHRTLADGLLSPLSLAVDTDGTTYFTQNFAGMLAKVRRGKAPKVLYRAANGNEVGGVSAHNGRVVFTETASDPQGNPADSWVKVLTRRGKARTLAHVRAYENKKNPDARVLYGARGISGECASQWPVEQAGPAVHQGLKDSHPYATWQSGRTVYVADAAMNAILAVRKHRIRTVAVLPPAAVKITAELAAGAGIPACAVGLTYYSEPVPTDVEKAPNGSLYVTTEGGGLGEMMPLGALYRIRGKKAHQVVGSLFGPVGLAINGRGDAFVSQLFGGMISKVKHGTHRARTFAKVNMPGALDWRGRLYATTDVLVGAGDPSAPPAAPGGKVVRYRR
ncbi:hypothetical protein SAMN04487968_101235 [Nocardioides terrae]|uniref:ScyD/ScyE family protein n=1 Tax=Nocardioides terrae TaxID=574651 RepID=A0A1I1DGA8_9ACTN|nr:ScyD/ScyE family protein [Nocardioides terrae]SFB73877.1 hypothetical protein SAMN04487968_101235 [Nocardioides terrae]